MPRRRLSSANRSRICARIETSSAETGSSATISLGRVMMARAIDSRWRWPPENSCAIFVDVGGRQPHLGSAAATRLRRSAPVSRSSSTCSGSATSRSTRWRGIERAVGILEHHLHLPAGLPQLPLRTCPVSDSPSKRTVPALGRSSASTMPGKGRLAAAGAADERHGLAGPDREGDVVDGVDGSAAPEQRGPPARINARQALHRKQRRRPAA